MNDRQQRIEIFQDTKRQYTENKKLKESIINTISETKIFKNTENKIERKYETPCKVVVSKKRTFEAAEHYKRTNPNEKVAALNFASATNPGGGVESGSSAQEECLCRCSTLYPCLKTDYLWNEFYKFHRNRHDVLYTDTCIYTPDVVVFKTDTSLPQTKKEEDWFTADVLTCAAPNLRERPYNAMNPGKGNAAKITEKELLELLKNRTEHILQVASDTGAETVILGAFGCGAFKNPPRVVARAFRESLDKYKYSFKTVEFAVFCKGTETENYDTFTRVFKNFG